MGHAVAIYPSMLVFWLVVGVYAWDRETDGDPPIGKPVEAATIPLRADQFTSPDDLERARQFSILACVGCHGRGLKGARGPDLTNWPAFRHGRDEQQVFQNIRSGIPGTGMLAVPG